MLRRFSAAVATGRAGHRKPRSGREYQRQRVTNRQGKGQRPGCPSPVRELVALDRE